MPLEAPPLTDTDAAAVAPIMVARDTDLRRLERYYHLAKRQAWSVKDLAWDQLPVLPETRTSDRWQGLWRSVLSQLVQADHIAVKASAELLSRAEHREATLYYTTMVQDEARHVEALMRVAEAVGELGQRNPYLDELADLQYDSETLEEKVICLQGFFEAMVIPFFHDISRVARGSILGELCQRLAVDDGIHHGSGLAYADVLMADASPALRRKVQDRLREFYPIYIEFVKWRPPERAWLSRLMADRDAQLIQAHIQFAHRLVHRWGLTIDL